MYEKEDCFSAEATGPNFNDFDTVLGVRNQTSLYITSPLPICERMSEYNFNIIIEPQTDLMPISISEGKITLFSTEEEHIGYYLVRVTACLKVDPSLCRSGDEVVVAIHKYKRLRYNKDIRYWPTFEEWKIIPLDNFTLSEVRYTLNEDVPTEKSLIAGV